MRTLYYSHSDFLLHNTGIGHPECANRLRVINTKLNQPEFSPLIKVSPPLGTENQLQLIHSLVLIQHLHDVLPVTGEYHLDDDTIISPYSERAALRAVGAVCDAVDKILTNQADNAFCAVRPPGHHAEPNRAMGFCLFNNVAIAAEYARLNFNLERIAIVDFDVHHGNGTQAAFLSQPNVMYISSHEMPNYPGTGYPIETGVGNIINIPLKENETGEAFKQKYERIVLPALREFKPELIFISAGFDAHQDDPLSSIRLSVEDFKWVTHALMEIAEQTCKGRIISVLEGGYHLEALEASVAGHVATLMGDDKAKVRKSNLR